MTTRNTLLMIATVTLLLPGCGTCGKCRLFGGRGLGNRDNNRRLDPPAPSRGTVDPLLIPPPAGGLPTTGVDAPPPGRSGTVTPSDVPPPSIPENRSFKSDGKELLLPDPLPGETSKTNKSINRNVPKYLEDPAEIRPAAKSTTEKPAATNTTAEVPGFSKVIPGVATGRKPTVDGFDTLSRSGYKSVLYLHSSNADTSAAKVLAEKRGLVFESLAVAPTNLKSAYPEFAKLVKDSTKQPLFVFDDDGVRSGNLWQIYFVKVDGESADAAQVKAGPLGLRDASDATFRLAVEAYLQKAE